MASDQSFVDYVREQLRAVPGLSERKMFGEYALYAGTRIFALICDNQLFIKPTVAGRGLLKKVTEAQPYPGAKPYFLIENELDDAEFLTALVVETVRELPEPKPKKPKQKKLKASKPGKKLK